MDPHTIAPPRTRPSTRFRPFRPVAGLHPADERDGHKRLHRQPYRAEGPGLVSPFFALAFGVAIASRHPLLGALLCAGGLLVLLSRMGLFPLPGSKNGASSLTSTAEATPPSPLDVQAAVAPLNRLRVWGFVGAASGVLLVLLAILVL